MEGYISNIGYICVSNCLKEKVCGCSKVMDVDYRLTGPQVRSHCIEIRVIHRHKQARGWAISDKVAFSLCSAHGVGFCTWESVFPGHCATAPHRGVQTPQSPGFPISTCHSHLASSSSLPPS